MKGWSITFLCVMVGFMLAAGLREVEDSESKCGGTRGLQLHGAVYQAGEVEK